MKTGLLALVGGDEFKPGNDAHDRLLVEHRGRGPAYVVPTAAARQRPDLAVATAQQWFKGLGLDVVELPVPGCGAAGIGGRALARATTIRPEDVHLVNSETPATGPNVWSGRLAAPFFFGDRYRAEVTIGTLQMIAQSRRRPSVGDVTVAINPADLVVLSEGADQLI